MFKNWEFVDPKLICKLKQAKQDLAQLKIKRASIQSNDRISRQAKVKLLKFNDECMKDLLQILAKHEQSMVDYFDAQVSVLTKLEANSSVSDSRDKSSEKLNSLYKPNQSQLTKLTFDEDRSMHSCNLNKTSHFINLYSCERQNSFKLDNLNTTGRLTTKIRATKHIKSFELGSTNRTYSHNQLDPHSRQNEKDPGKREKASIFKTYKMRAKRQLAHKQFELQMEKLLHYQTSERLKKVEKEQLQDKQLIELLRKKVSLLQLNQHSKIKEEKQKIEAIYEKQVSQLRQTFIELSQLQEDNRSLQLQRKEMLGSWRK